jgi:hypothetical protein
MKKQNRCSDVMQVIFLGGDSGEDGLNLQISGEKVGFFEVS